MAIIILSILLTIIVPVDVYAEEKELFDFQSSGNWGSYTIGQDGARAVTNTNVADIGMSLDFPSSDCSIPYLTIHVRNAKISDIGKSDIIQRSIKLRVDTRDIWNVEEASTEIQESIDGRSAVLAVALRVNNEFLNEVRAGTTLRIKIEDISAFRTSLNGSRRAINRAISLCLKTAESEKSDDRYFERRVVPCSDDERYF